MHKMTGVAIAPFAGTEPSFTSTAGSRADRHANAGPGAAGRQEPLNDVGHDRDQQDWLATTPGERLRVRLHSREVDGKFCILENIADSGTATPMHIHAEDEVSRVLEGEVVFSVHGKVSTLREGSQVLIRSGTPHAWRNRSGRPVRLLTVFSPGGIEALFLRMPGLPPAEAVKLAADYGTLLIGPPLPE
jgi:quercetin dioxygenase-like cupin family protein